MCSGFHEQYQGDISPWYCSDRCDKPTLAAFCLAFSAFSALSVAADLRRDRGAGFSGGDALAAAPCPHHTPAHSAPGATVCGLQHEDGMKTLDSHAHLVVVCECAALRIIRRTSVMHAGSLK